VKLSGLCFILLKVQHAAALQLASNGIPLKALFGQLQFRNGGRETGA
jgi:hypothetical protein